MSNPTEVVKNAVAENSGPPLIEIGWIIAGRLDDADREAFYQAQDHLLAYLKKTFAGFIWRMPVVHRDELVRTNREELVVLLDYGVAEREAKQMDFAFIITEAHLIGHYKT